MKRYMAFLLAFFLFLVSSAMAGEYKVRSGDYLIKIAKSQGADLQALKDANPKVKGPKYVIYVGQTLVIPKKGLKTTQTTPAQKSANVQVVKRKPVFKKFISGEEWRPYSHPDSAPVGKETDPTEYIKKSGFPAKVIDYFVEKAIVKNFSDGAWGEAFIAKADNPNLPKGAKAFDRLDFMGSGKSGDVLYKLYVNFDMLRKAWFLNIEYDGWMYYLICDQKCYNWSGYKMKAPATKAKAIAPPPPKKEVVTENPPVAVAPAEPVKEVVTENPPVAVAPAEPVKEVAPAPKAAAKVRYKPDFEAWLYGGHNVGIESDNSGDEGSYYGLGVSLFLLEAPVGNGKFRIGPSYQYTGWDGTSGNVDYEGFFNLFGVEGQYLTDSTKTYLKVLYGQKEGDVFGNGFPYYAHETADILAFEGAYQWWNPAKDYQMEVGFRAELASNNEKYSTWDGNPIPANEDPALDQSMFSGRIKGVYTRWEDFMPTAEVSGNYRASNEKFGAQGRLGVKTWDEIIEVGGTYDVVEDGSDMAGVYVNIDMSKMIKKAYYAAKRSLQKSPEPNKS